MCFEESEIRIHAEICRKHYLGNIPPEDVICECACKATGISMDLLNSKTRKRQVVLARQLIILYLCSNADPKMYPYEKISRLVYGKNDHASCLHNKRELRTKLDLKDKIAIKACTNFINNIYQLSPMFQTSMIPIKRGTSKFKRKKNKL